MKVAVIGAGSMGTWFARLMKKLGEVTVSDINRSTAESVARELNISASTLEKAVMKADVVLIAVPVSETPGMVKKVSGIVKKNPLIMDISSVKSEVVDTMKNMNVRAELASIHPLFGPGATTVDGKDFISVPVKTGKRYRGFIKFLRDNGARITETNADEHDRVMSIIQSLTHFTIMAYIASMGSCKDFKKIGRMKTPLFTELRELAKCMLSANPEVYGEIQVHNIYSRMVRSRFLEACRAMDLAFSSGDSRCASDFMNNAKKLFSEKELKRSYTNLYRRFEGEKE
ncbi:MAG: prephenate dehydrogenase/arogenate dehydrogenase family protein [Candidatus Hadarchaeales archaeon]